MAIKEVGVGFVIVGNNGTGAYHSIDGLTWTISTGLGTNLQFESVVYGKDKYVAVTTSSANIYYSTDGINWTKSSNISYVVSGVAYGNGKFVAVGSSGRGYYSTDGITWNLMTVYSTNYDYLGVTFANGKFVAVGRDGISAYSTDGQNWTNMSGLNSSYHYIGVTYGKDRFVAVGRNGMSAYSTNGTSWIAMSGLNSSNNYYDVTYGNDRFVCVGNNGASYYSLDGETWVVMSGLSNSWFNGVAYGNDRFICVSDTGGSYYSTNGETWLTISELSGSMLAITYGIKEVEIHPQIILGTNKPNILKLGATDLIKAYLGTNLVYQKEAGWVLKTGNFIPTFSSGEVSKDNFNITYDGFTASVDNDVYKMFDNDDETGFLIQYNNNIDKSSTCNVIMEFAKTIKPTKINFNYLSAFSNLSISLSADNVNFDTVYSLNNEEADTEENVTIELDNLIEYKYLKISATSGGSNMSSNVLEIYTLQVVEWYEEV